MEDEIRIEKDIEMFKENVKKIKQNEINSTQKRTMDLANQYYEDSKYYLNKKDYFTAFGCINYAHGLLDSILKF
ncbi:MAG: DUF357 domain-containing protein [Thermoplasmatales archaeon]|nr:MAG: DUF357 domain-containing protein [Thermoplasmatales archaeon]